jgi:(2Fe-2S) ferredoxin
MNENEPLPEDLCSTESASVPLFATAPDETDAWLLLEFALHWPAKILDDPPLPAAVIERLRAFEKNLMNARVQFVRRPRRPVDTPLLFFGRSGDGGWLRWMELPAYEALLDLDLEGIVTGAAEPPGTPWTGPLVLVCTHGKRDRCCALKGAALYRALEDVQPGAVWQASHLGGHRFAPTVAVLPDGHYYGRVSPGEAEDFMCGVRENRLPRLDRLRGRAGRPAPAQAAEHFLREATGETGLDAVSVAGVEPLGEETWRVTLTRGGAEHQITVRSETGGPMAPASCGKERVPTTRFVLVEHRDPGHEIA